MVMKRKRAQLWRYTSLPLALDLLSRRQLTLRSPSTWEDRNDAYYLERYAERKKKGVVAVCFTKKPERFHHWKIFASGSAGVCIQFDKARLLDQVPKAKGFRHDDVTYHFIKKLKNPDVETWPFLKRVSFAAEEEFRIIGHVATGSIEAVVDIADPNPITKIILSPWLPVTAVPSVIGAIQAIAGFEGLKVEHSKLLDTKSWRQIIDATSKS